ncbi:MAG: hypothetical protein FJ267_08370 [Planctomycetes bacterium]|nr:hypothetical protein [Planctomycetota bacterium]
MEPIAYLNGNDIPISQASLHVFDLGIVGGVSVTEMIRTFCHRPFRLEDHLDRLEQSLDFVGLKAGLSRDELMTACHRIVEANSKLIPDHHDLGVIIFVTAGVNPTYVGRVGSAAAKKSTVCIHTFPLPFELWNQTFHDGIHLVTVETRSIPDNVIDARIKHRSRMHWTIADRQAKQKDSQATAVLTSSRDFLTETAAGNVWFVKEGDLMTPARNILHGVSRQVVLELAESLGLNCLIGDFSPVELYEATEIFLSSTPSCLQPVTKFNGRLIGNGKPGSIFQTLLQAWSQEVGLNIIEQMSLGAQERLATS